MSTSFAVDLVFKTKGQSGIQSFEQTTKQLDQSAKRAQGSLDKAEKEVKQFGRSAKRASTDASSLLGTLKRLAVAAAGFQLGKQIAQVGIDSIEAERRIRALSGAFGEIDETSAAVDRIAKKFGLTEREANKAFSQIYARLRPIGIELGDIESAFNGFNTAARLSGTSAQEASAAWLQLSQALGSGVLRGEELNSVFEQTPTVVQAIAKEMNAPIGQIRQLAQDGKITSDIVLRALKRLETEGVNQLAEAMNGPRQKFKDFSNSVETLSNALATTVLPDLSDSISEVGETILLLEGPIKFVSGLLKTALSEVNQLIREITKAPAAAAAADLRRGGTGQNLVNAFTFRDPNEGLKQLFGEQGLKDLKAKAEKYAKLRNQTVKEVFSDLALDRLNALDGDGYIKSVDNSIKPQTRLDKTTKTGGGAASKVTSELDKQRKELERQFEAGEAIKRARENELMLLSAATDLDKKRVQNAIDLDNKIRDIYANAAPAQQKELIAGELRLAQLKDQKLLMEAMGTDFGQWASDKLPQANQELTETQQLLKGSYDIIAGQLQGAIQGLIKGTSDWGDVLSNILSQLGGMFLQAGFNGLGTALKIPGYANGGRPQIGQVSLVGERGPELFVPDTPGTVLSNDESFAAARSALSGGGSGSDADDEAAAALGIAGGDSVASSKAARAAAFELARVAMVGSTQTRSAATAEAKQEQQMQELMSQPSESLVKFETFRVGALDVVSREEAIKIGQQSAQQARAMTLSDLRNKPATRKRAGV